MEDVKIRMSIAKSTFDGLVKAGNAEQDRSFFLLSLFLVPI